LFLKRTLNIESIDPFPMANAEVPRIPLTQRYGQRHASMHKLSTPRSEKVANGTITWIPLHMRSLVNGRPCSSLLRWRGRGTREPRGPRAFGSRCEANEIQAFWTLRESSMSAVSLTGCVIIGVLTSVPRCPSELC